MTFELFQPKPNIFPIIILQLIVILNNGSFITKEMMILDPYSKMKGVHCVKFIYEV